MDRVDWILKQRLNSAAAEHETDEYADGLVGVRWRRARTEQKYTYRRNTALYIRATKDQHPYADRQRGPEIPGSLLQHVLLSAGHEAASGAPALKSHLFDIT